MTRVRSLNPKAYDRLSERQKQCLRLFHANFEIKEIGLELALSPNTVKKYLGEARGILGVSRSAQAARLLVDYEGDTLGIPPLKRLGSDSDLPQSDSAAGQNSGARERYPLGFLARIGLIVAIAFIAVAFAGALVVGVDAINRFFVGYRIDISDPPYRD